MADDGSGDVLPAPAPGSTPVPEGLLDAVAAYEHALMTDDLAAMDRLFARGPGTLRADAAGPLVGHDAIAAFRGRRGGAPTRTVREVHVRGLDDDHAVVVAVTGPVTGGRGLQTQLWRRDTGGWVVDVAHVSGPPGAVDGSVWRVAGAPLVPPHAPGPLDGVRVAVKDVVAVAGHPVGAGVPAWLAGARPEPAHAPALDALLRAGAAVQGIARTDELAYSIAGRNPHYGTPPNPCVRGGLPGGSSSGPAAAVALGQADLGLGTDTAGSIRVPASYQGLWGLRPTHGRVSVDGVLPLAPSFDTVGWLARDAATLRAAAGVTLPAPADGAGLAGSGPEPVVDPALLELLDPEVTAAVAARTATLGARTVDLTAAAGPPAHLAAAFRTVQGAEAWRAHGEWITAHPGALGPEVAARFAWASSITPAQAAEARAVVDAARRALVDVLAGRVLVLPAAAGPAPDASLDGASVERTRTATLTLTSLAGVLGAPALSVPALAVGGAPLGLCLVGPPGSDLALVDLATDWFPPPLHGP